MNLYILMQDAETGELLYKQHKILACQFERNDVAFNLMHKVLESCVRGVRFKNVPVLDLWIRFSEDDVGNSPYLPFDEDKEKEYF